MQLITSINGVPKPVGPYSIAKYGGNFLFMSGLISLDENSGALIGENAAEQTQIILENMSKILHHLGLSFENVLKMTVYLVNIEDFTEMNSVYAKYFKESLPARSCIEVSNLPKSALVEMDAIAIKEN